MSVFRMIFLSRRLSGLAAATALVLGAAFGSPAHATQIKRVVSSMGIVAWLVEEHTVPLVSINFAFFGGAANDPPERRGVGNMMAALLDEGAGDLDSHAFQEREEELAMRIGFDVGRDNLYGELKTLTRNRDDAVAMLALAINSPRFDEEAVERIRAQILTGIRRRSQDPETLVSLQWSRIAFGDHPYGQPVSGDETTVAAITRADLLAAKGQLMSRNQLRIGVVGDISEAELGPVLDRLFGALPATTALAPVATATVNEGPRRAIIDMNIPQTVIQFGHEGIARDDPDFLTAYIVNHILGGGTFSSRLYEEVREKRGLAYSVSTGIYPLDKAALFVGSVATKNDRAAETLATIEAEIARLAEDGPSKEELADAKSYLTGSYALRFDTSDKIAGQLVAIQLDRLGIDYIDKRNAMIEAITLEDVRRVARRLLETGKLITVIAGRPKGLAPIAPVQ